MLTLTALTVAEGQQTLYLYNPESNINNFITLKAGIDKALSSHHGQVQPFNSLEDFDRVIKGQQRGVFLLSSWNIKRLQKNITVQAMLVGVANGRSTQKKILSSKSEIHTIEQLRGKRIASAGSVAFTRELLRSMLGPDYTEMIDDMRILSVPKDVDALFSVGFGLADAAITTERSLAMIQSINPTLAKSFNAIKQSQNFLLPIVAIFGDSTQDQVELVQAIEAMGDAKKWKRNMQMLGLDGWKHLQAEDLRLLNE